MVVSPKGLDEGWLVMVMVMVRVMVRVKCVGVGLLWFGLVRKVKRMDEMDEAMMKHLHAIITSPLI